MFLGKGEERFWDTVRQGMVFRLNSRRDGYNILYTDPTNIQGPKALKARDENGNISKFTISKDEISISFIITDLKKEIIELGETPVKRKALQNGRLYIEDLKVQKEELEKEKEKQAKIDAVKNEIIKELEKLGEKPLSVAKDIDTDEEIIALRKQLDDLKKKIKDKEEKEKKEAEAKK